MATNTSQVYLAIVRRRAEGRAAERLETALGSLLASFDSVEFATVYARAGRWFGHAAVEVDDAEARACEAAGARAPRGWPLDEVARATLLLAAGEGVPAERHPAVVADLFYRGDNAERQALLRALAMLPEPARFVDVAVEACRTNVVPVFEAIACENSYPRAHFPELHFNQMVIKALFLGVAVARIEGLDARMNPELVRMATDYAAERRAAGRPVPADLGRIAPDAAGAP